MVGSLVTITFGKSSSRNYRKALRLAQEFSSFTALSENSEVNSVEVGQEEFRQKYRKVQSLWLNVCNWKSSELRLEGVPADLNEVRKLFAVVECARDYSSAVIRKDHCKIYGERNGWGCKFLNTIDPYLPSSRYYLIRGRAYWFQFGGFESATQWKIDKQEIRAALAREAEIKRLCLCPVFDLQKTEQVLSELPDTIDVEDSDKWEIQWEEETDEPTVDPKPVGVAPKSLGNDRHPGLTVSVGGEMQVGRQQSKRTRFIPSVRFDEIGGIDDILQSIREVIELPLKHPQLLRHLGVRPHRGILMYGQPGCGKTLVAKAIANEVEAHFISVRGPELFSMWYGESEHNLRRVFEEARDLQPAIIFFDEIDSVAARRSEHEALRHDSRFVNQLLTLMDGMEDFGNVCVIASTNRPELLDEALLRPGRFDYSLEVKKPTREGCRTIFAIHTRTMPVSSDFDLGAFSADLEGLTGAQIAFVAREGAYNCLRRNLDIGSLIKGEGEAPPELGKLVIVERDFREALERVEKP